MKNITDILFFFILIAGSVILGRFVSVEPTGLPVYFIIGFLAVGLSLLDMRIAVGFLVMSMLLSPEIPIAGVPRRAVVIRFDDLLLIIIFISWLAKQAVNKKLPLLKASPINKYIFYYVAACFLFTGKGILMGNVDYRQAVFYLLKYLEYFMIFWMTYNVINKKEDINIILKFFLITAVIIIVHSYFIFPERMYAPFDQEPASVGGYFLILTGLSLGLAIFNKKNYYKIFYTAVLVSLLPLIIFTQSRATYAGIPALYITVVALTTKYKKMLLLAGIGAVVLLPVVLGGGLYDTLIERISYTFTGGSGTYGLDPSSAARITSWRTHLLQNFPRRPLTGWGVTGRGFIDSQYVRTLVELGLIGFFAFALLKYKIVKYSVKIYKLLDNNWYKGLVIGFIGATAGLFMHATTSNTFIIVRIMGPFWFVTAIVLSLPRVLGKELK